MLAPIISSAAAGAGLTLSAVAPYAFPVDVRAGPLNEALQDLARQTGAELLFDRAALRGITVKRLIGRMTLEAALEALLRDTGFAAHRTASGAWLVERRSSTPATPTDELAEPEILVVGRRTQNVDIRRQENDIQPYQVSTRAQIVNAHRNNLEQYFNSAVTANTRAVTASQNQSGDTSSQIDLHGLGAGQTLILVDGRRLPGIPREPMTYQQPDINAIPLHAIDRVETLTGTAGGIYGFGALGGVVNIVLRRDLRGFELHATTGISTHGDARRLNLEGGFGFSPDGGATDVMFYVSHSEEQAVREGARGYTERAREIALRLQPDYVNGYAMPITSNAINIATYNFAAGPLVLRPEYGGASLASNYTYLPLGFSGTPSALISTLTRNAGQVDLTLSNPANASDIGSTPSTTSAIMSVRHQFDGGMEAYLDGLLLRNIGRNRDYSSGGLITLPAGAPGNPFQNTIQISFPGPSASTERQGTFTTTRATGGLIVPLGQRWKATAEASFGAARLRGEGRTTGILSVNGTSPLNPFANWEAFQQDLAGYLRNASLSSDSTNRYREQSLRIAGPLLRTAAGPATLTLLAQNRVEKVLGYWSDYETSSALSSSNSSGTSAGRSSATRSFSAQLDAPLIADAADVPLLKGLTLQLALRHDDQTVHFYADPDQPTPESALRARFAATTFTVGAKFLPAPWLMLRGSYATGEQPPPLVDLVEYDNVSGLFLISDPKRPGASYRQTGSFLNKTGGSPNLKSIRASTLSLGVVLNPRAEGGPRVSFDYSRIRRTRDPVDVFNSDILANEDRFPERVTRLPLTDADRALGYTAGQITMIDATMMSIGTFLSRSVDARFDWSFPFAGGTLRTNGNATLQIESRSTSISSVIPGQDVAGYQGGPLRWRASGGLEWDIGRMTLGANAQYFSRYHVRTSNVDCCTTIEQLQGSPYVRAQTYVDLYASRRFSIQWAGKPREFSLDFGIVNLLDAAPPYVAQYTLSGLVFSPYGDIRQRRVELAINANF